MTDHHTPGTASYGENAEGYGLGRAGMEWFWARYLRAAADAAHPRAAPLRAASLAGLPPALVFTAAFDPPRDEGAAYGARSAAAGVPAGTVRWNGMNRGFFALTGWVGKADAAMRSACAWLTVPRAR